MWYSKRARRFSAIGADGGAEGGADRAEAMGRAGLAAVAGGRLEEGGEELEEEGHQHLGGGGGGGEVKATQKVHVGSWRKGRRSSKRRGIST